MTTHKAKTLAAIAETNLQTLRSDIIEMLSTPGGRRIYAWLDGLSGIWEDAPATEPDRTAWVGHRALGLAITRAFREADPEGCFRALRERDQARDLADRAVEEAIKQDLAEAAAASPFETNKRKDTP